MHPDAAPSVVTLTPVIGINLNEVRREMPEETSGGLRWQSSEISYYEDESFFGATEEGKLLWRLGILLRFGAFLNLLRVMEEALYRALGDLCELSVATTAQHMLEALHFLHGTARLVLIDFRTVNSGHCKGVAKDVFS